MSRQPLASRALRLHRTLTIFALVALLGACKIVIMVPENGRVTSANGEVCLAGETCVIEVTTTDYEDVFTAVPDAGYSFKRWKAADLHFCGNATGNCRLSTVGFDAFPILLDILASDDEFFMVPVFVSSANPYDVDYWSQVAAEIDAGKFATNDILYAIPPIVGQCDPGQLTRRAHLRALEAVNQVRDLHRLPHVDREETFDMQAQEAALVQKANNYLSHFPDSGDRCYSANADSGARTSNLFGGAQADPASHVIGWTNDNQNLAVLMEAGHRRWILDPDLGYVSYGQVRGPAALKVFGFSQPPRRPVPGNLQYVAFPFKTYPYLLVSKGDKPTPWSLSMVPPAGVDSQFDYFSNASVQVVDKQSGQQLSVHSLHRDNKRFGLANFLSWMVDGWEHDRNYTVTVSNIRLPGGGTREVTYPVRIDRFNLLNLTHPLEAGDTQSGTTMSGGFQNPKDQDSYSLDLAGNLSVSGSSEFSGWAFFVMVYDNKKQLVASSDQPFSQNFSGGKHTVVISPCNEAGLCYQGVTSYNVRFN
jgi:hypothetical protein